LYAFLYFTVLKLTGVVIEHDNGFIMVNTRTLEPGTKLYVLPSQCDQVFYSYVPGKVVWPYVAIYDPRVRLVKYNVAEEYDIEEDDDVEEKVDVLDKEDK
jgi:hypothetical protein